MTTENSNKRDMVARDNVANQPRPNGAKDFIN